MPTNRDKGQTEKAGDQPSQQKAPSGVSSSAGVDADLAAEARGGKVDDGAEGDLT